MKRFSAVLLLTLLHAWPSLAAEIEEVVGFGPNPGELRMFKHVPAGLPAGSALVVALHGCTQSAGGLGVDSGWIELADRLHVALLLPEQRPANSDDLCFNFFRRDDNRRGQGEAASIRAMIDRMLTDYRLDPKRVFVNGFSAGGGMTAVMLAAYPDVFAAGAIIAGLPYGCASTSGDWFRWSSAWWVSRSNPYGEAGWASYACGITRKVPGRFVPYDRQPADWALLAREAGAPAGAAWPPVSIWQGDADMIVHPANLPELLDQWTALHGVDRAPDRSETTSAYTYRAFADSAGTVRVEAFLFPGLGHAVPVDPGAGPAQCGDTEDSHYEDHDVCAADRIARFWGLAP